MTQNPAETPDQGAGGIPAWTLGDRLAKALKHADLDQQQMAEHLELSRNTISNYINDHTRPKRSVVWDWAVRCGVPPTWLATGEIDLRDPSDQGNALNRCSIDSEDDNVLIGRFPLSERVLWGDELAD